MKAEFSHSGFLNSAEYTSVKLQEGRMITDRDFNAGCEIQKARQDAFGRITFNTGVPRSGGLLTGVGTGIAQFAPLGGTVVAGGRAGQARPQAPDGAFGYYNQADLNIPVDEFSPGILYADIFEDSINSYEDQDLRDEALHGADTVTAIKQYVQIKRCDESLVIQNECGSVFEPGAMPQIGTGEFSVDLRASSGIADQCDPCANEITLDETIDNSLFRMEVQNLTYDEDGMPLTVTLKWSHENGGIIFPQTAMNDIFNADYSFEYYTPQTQSHMGIPAEGLGTAVETSTLFHGSVTARSVLPNALVRRWDGYALINLQSFSVEGWDKGVPLQAGSSTHGGVSDTPDGYVFNLDQLIVTLDLKDKAILIGDYWLALLRSASRTARALSVTPRGIKHEYCILGYSEDGINISINPADLARLQSPDLSCLHADTIHYTPSIDCEYAGDARNVEEALNAFCGHIGQLYEEVAAPLPPPSSFPIIKNVRWAIGDPFENDRTAYRDWVSSGFEIEFSDPMQIAFMSDDVITMTVDMPRYSPVNSETQTIPDLMLSSVIISGVVSAGSNSNSIRYTPDTTVLNNVYSEIKALNAAGYTKPIRIRIAVNGRFLFADDGRPCDGFVPGRAVTEQVNFEDIIVDSSGGTSGVGSDQDPGSFSSGTSAAEFVALRFGSSGVVGGATSQSSDYSVRRRIALAYEQAGSGIPSKFEAWFYASLASSPGGPNVLDGDASSVAMLATLPGINDFIARSMVERRGTFKTVDEMAGFYGISAYNKAQLETMLYFSKSGATGPSRPPIALPKEPSDGNETPPPTSPPEPHLNLHTMNREELLAVDGIGLATYERIKNYREKNLILGRESLLEAGISNSTISLFIDKVCF